MKSIRLIKLSATVSGILFASAQFNVAQAQQYPAGVLPPPPPPAYTNQRQGQYPNFRPNNQYQGQNPARNNARAPQPNWNNAPNRAPNPNWNNNRYQGQNQNWNNAPRYNNNPYNAPWGNQGYNRGFNSNNFTPWGNNDGFNSNNMPMMNSNEWARKIPGWNRNSGPWRGGPWNNDSFKGRMTDMWDDGLNAPNRMGRMPGGWKAPTISVPNPVDVGEQFGEAVDDMPDNMRDMNVSN